MAEDDEPNKPNILLPSEHAGIDFASDQDGKLGPRAGLIILPHRLVSGRDPFGLNLAQSARTKLGPGWFCTILSGLSVEGCNRV